MSHVPGVHLYDMERRLRELDPTLAFRVDSKGFVCIVRFVPVLQYLGHFRDGVLYFVSETYHHVMRLTDESGRPRPPDVRDLERLREIDTWGRSNHIQKMDARNAARERAADRRLSDIGYEMGKDIHWFLKKEGAIH